MSIHLGHMPERWSVLREVNPSLAQAVEQELKSKLRPPGHGGVSQEWSFPGGACSICKGLEARVHTAALRIASRPAS